MSLFDKFTTKTEEQEAFKETSRFGNLKIDDVNKLFKVGKNVYKFEDLFSFELFEDKQTIAQGGVSLGRAIVGGALFGEAGATAGALSKVNKSDNEFCSSMQILFTVKNHKQATGTIPFIFGKTNKSKLVYRVAKTNAKATLEGFNFIVENNKPAEDSTISNFDDLKKLKELLDLGIITQNEFNTKKKELLNL